MDIHQTCNFGWLIRCRKRYYKVAHCARHVSTNTRPCQLHACTDWLHFVHEVRVFIGHLSQLMWHTDMQWVPTWHHPKLAATALERIVFTYAWWNIPCSPIDGAHQYTKYWIIMLHNYIQEVLLLRSLAGDMALPPAQPEQAKPTIYAWNRIGYYQISISQTIGGNGVWSHETRTFKLIQHSCYQFLTLKISAFAVEATQGLYLWPACFSCTNYTLFP